MGRVLKYQFSSTFFNAPDTIESFSLDRFSKPKINAYKKLINIFQSPQGCIFTQNRKHFVQFRAVDNSCQSRANGHE